MLSRTRRPGAVAGLSRPAVRRRLFRRPPPARVVGELDHRADRLRPVAGDLLHLVDLLRRGRPGRDGGLRLHPDLYRAGAGDHRRLSDAAQAWCGWPSSTTSPRSPTSSPRATARAAPSASPPPCSPRSACCPTSRCSCRPCRRPSARRRSRRRWIDGRAGVVHTDTSLIVAGLMAVFTILFGVRNVQASEQHRGMMLAIAFELVVKLVALLTVGPFVLFVLFDGPSDLWRQARRAARASPSSVTREGSPLTWIVDHAAVGRWPSSACRASSMSPSSSTAIRPACAPRAGCSRCYLVLINLFVLPIAAAGLLLLGRRSTPTSTCCSCRSATARAGCRPWSSSAACRRRPRW